ncbi:MAG: His/Gly/Thr/Pro-type tRNA ligase C-terminal domain-containing protein, partial [Pseudomonadota bacterium]|nr:His/Gly/Thr/Pro-type tRNA ligase C-terminal domain-containing protein [Pseudomonadota bacterium]
KKTNEASDSFYTKLRENNIDVLYDNSEERPGVKFANMDLIGLPWQLTVGKKALSNNNIDLKRRSDGKRQEMSLDSALDLISK